MRERERSRASRSTRERHVERERERGRARVFVCMSETERVCGCDRARIIQTHRFTRLQIVCGGANHSAFHRNSSNLVAARRPELGGGVYADNVSSHSSSSTFGGTSSSCWPTLPSTCPHPWTGHRTRQQCTCWCVGDCVCV